MPPRLPVTDLLSRLEGRLVRAAMLPPSSDGLVNAPHVALSSPVTDAGVLPVGTSPGLLERLRDRFAAAGLLTTAVTPPGTLQDAKSSADGLAE